MGARFVGVVGDLDAACFAASADLHLRLDDDRIADLVSGGDRFVDRIRGFPGWHGNVEAGKILFALILKQIQ